MRSTVNTDKKKKECSPYQKWQSPNGTIHVTNFNSREVDIISSGGILSQSLSRRSSFGLFQFRITYRSGRAFSPDLECDRRRNCSERRRERVSLCHETVRNRTSGVKLRAEQNG